MKSGGKKQTKTYVCFLIFIVYSSKPSGNFPVVKWIAVLFSQRSFNEHK